MQTPCEQRLRADEVMCGAEHAIVRPGSRQVGGVSANVSLPLPSAGEPPAQQEAGDPLWESGFNGRAGVLSLDEVLAAEEAIWAREAVPATSPRATQRRVKVSSHPCLAPLPEEDPEAFAVQLVGALIFALLAAILALL